jgi:hypothetical protein
MNKGKNNQGTVTLNEETPRNIEELVDDFFTSGKTVKQFEQELGQRELTIWKAKKDEYLLEDLEDSHNLFEDDLEDEPFFDDGFDY